MKFLHLFSPIEINTLKLSNRIVMTAMHLGYTPEGEITDRLIEFYRKRAQGGVGLIIVGGCLVDEYGGMKDMIGLNEDRFIPGLQRLTSTIKKEGTPIAAQLYQAGRYTHSSMIGGRKPFSASAVRSRLTGETPRALELDEIPMVQQSFAEAAIRAKKAGFDAVEVLASAGYLISQFLSPITNLRKDRYGGSLENRMRFGLEVVEKVREAVGPDFPVIVRIAGNEFMEGGNTNQEAIIFSKELERAGADLINVTGGWHETRIPQLSTFVPKRAFVYLASRIKQELKIPVLASNRINDPLVAEEILRNGEADLVTMARALIADPMLPKKAKEGKDHLIYHCIACNQGCFDSIFRFKSVCCTVNPEAGLEKEIKIEKSANRKRVLIIGGGIAGMKTAEICARKGHEVILVEREECLGGQVLLNRYIPGREELVQAVKDIENNLLDLNVRIILGKEADKEFIKSMAPDVLVIATGAKPKIPEIQGSERPNVHFAWDVIKGRARVGKRVIIIGGNAVGLEAALYIANIGTLNSETLYFLFSTGAESESDLREYVNRGIKEVTVIEMDKKAGKDIGASTKWTVMSELRRLGVKILTSTKALEITEKGVLVEKEGERVLLKTDSVVIATGSESVRPSNEGIEEITEEVYIIGDAKEPRNMLHAIKEGFNTGLKI